MELWPICSPSTDRCKSRKLFFSSFFFSFLFFNFVLSLLPPSTLKRLLRLFPPSQPGDKQARRRRVIGIAAPDVASVGRSLGSGGLLWAEVNRLRY
ncbi:hypothetical protein GQ53DRAFT_461047 [Thozetella sp. PMI_491]|nr:hypothetical protein GQ53DRAFT_461047 [Thozetella sp. PMI_491]